MHEQMKHVQNLHNNKLYKDGKIIYDKNSKIDWRNANEKNYK